MTTLPQTAHSRVPQAPSIGLAPQPVFAPPAPQSSGFQMSGGDIWRMLRRNAWLIIALVVLAGVAGYFANQEMLKRWPTYSSVGLVQVETSLVVDPRAQNTEMGTDRLVTELKTQAAKMKSASLISTVLKNENSRLRATAWARERFMKNGVLDAVALRAYIEKYYNVFPVQDSALLSVSFDCGSPEDSRTIVYELVDTHIREENSAAEKRFTQQTQVLRGLEGSYSTEIRELETAIDQLQKSLAAKGVGSRVGFNSKDIELQELLRAQLIAFKDFSEQKAEAERVQGQIQRGEQISEVERLIDNDPLVASLQNQTAALEIQMAVIASGGEKRPEISRLETMITQQRETMENRRKELRIKYRDTLLNLALSKAGGAEAQYKQLKERVDTLKGEQAELVQDYSTLQNKSDAVKVLRDLKNQTTSRLKDMQAVQNAVHTDRIHWASEPVVPELPSWPKLIIVLPISIVLGLGLGLGIAFLRELLDDTVRSPRDVSRVGQMNMLGMIADEGDDPQAADSKLPIFDAPQSLTAEQFRQVRTRLQHAAALDTTRSIMITGPSPRDGKTTVAANLAAGLALIGRKILLVDANFRRPDIHTLFGVTNERGLSDVLNGSAQFDDTLHHTRIPNLSVMPSGPKPPNATELFESQLITDFIERALEEFDHVIFDTGPFLVVSEAVALAPRVDGVVTVVRAHSESRGLLQRLRDSLRQVKAEHIGVVLNAVRAQGGGYYGRNIKTFYSYQNER